VSILFEGTMKTKFLALLCIFLVGCSSPTPDVSGIWKGTAGWEDIFTVSAEYILNQTGKEITGVGKLTDNVGVISFSVEGIYHHPDIYLMGRSSIYGEFLLIGKVNRDRIQGDITFFGNTLPVVLRGQ
jgi:hypothetical protein